MSANPAVPAISGSTPLLLASGSTYRAELLRRLWIPFEAIASHVDERKHPTETPAALAQRLALDKARAVARLHPNRWVLGSDQVASSELSIFGKPGTVENAVAQLEALSGKVVTFHTAVALVCGSRMHAALDTTRVRFRTLDRAEIERYVAAEPALDCAGGFKCEGLGITLISSIESSDPTGLIGLPLIAVRELLAHVGVALP